jgi:anti-sigma regulatory factor (Ser/Thr protein kinase)
MLTHLYHHEFRSCPSEMSDVRARLREVARQSGFEADQIEHLILAVDEACTNIMRHAYEGHRHGRIELDVFTRGEMWEIRIRDYGKKCDPEKMKGRSLEEVRPGGLGLHFIHSTFDEVHYDHSSEEGTCLFLRKKKPAPAAPRRPHPARHVHHHKSKP